MQDQTERQTNRLTGRQIDGLCLALLIPTQVRLLDTCPVSVREESDDHVLVQKKVEALEWCVSAWHQRLTLTAHFHRRCFLHIGPEVK